MEEPEKAGAKETEQDVEGKEAPTAASAVTAASEKVSEELRECVSRMGAVEMELMSRLADMIPGDFVEHLLNARREALLAFRNLIDAALEKTEDRRGTWERIVAKRGAAPDEATPRKVPLE